MYYQNEIRTYNEDVHHMELIPVQFQGSSFALYIARTWLQAAGKYAETAYEESLVVETPENLIETFDKDKDFTFKCNITLRPELSWKGDYKKLKVD